MWVILIKVRKQNSMSKIKQYKSGAFAAIHESMDALYRVGAIDKKTMQRFDRSCLEPIQNMSPNEIMNLRKREGVSQRVLALYMNVTEKVVVDWESGDESPTGTTLRLLHVIRVHGIDTLTPAKSEM